MTEYCRLCAELKNCEEIVASIEDVEHSMEQKLRACCQWTAENTEHRLPNGVCSICLDDLDKSWLFTQTVQFAQQRLREIFEETDTKPEPSLTAGDLLSAIDEPTLNSSTRGQNHRTLSRLNEHNTVPTSAKRGPLECPLCVHKPFATPNSLKIHLITHVNNSNGELKVVGFNHETRIIRADGDGDPIPLGLEIFPCITCNQIFGQQYYLKRHQGKCSKKRKIDGRKHDNRPSASTAQIDTINQQPLHTHGGQNSEHTCGICSQAFCTVADLDAHQQHACEGLIEIESNFMDLKPSAVDLIESESEMDTGENAAVDGDDDGDDEGLNASDAQSTNSDRLGEHRNEQTKLNGQASPKEPQTSDNCNGRSSTLSNITQKNAIHADAKTRSFECQLCVHAPFTEHRLLKRHLISHVNNSNGELKFEGTNKKTRIIRANGDGDPIPFGLRIYECTDCNRIFDIRYSLKRHEKTCAKKLKIDERYNLKRIQNKHLTSTSSDQTQQQSLDNQGEDLDAHQRQRCEGSVEIESNVVNPMPPAVDSTASENGMDTDENQEMDNNDGGGSNAIDEQSTNSDRFPNDHEPKNSNDRAFRLKWHSVAHTRPKAGPLEFKCQLCDHKPFTSHHTLQRHLFVHVNDSNGELKIDGVGKESRIIRTNGDGDPIPLGLKVFECAECNRIFPDKHKLKMHLFKHVKDRTHDEYKYGDKGPFKCRLCEKEFTRKQHLCAHLVSHVLQSKGELKIEEINNENGKRPKFQIVQANGGGGAPICIPGKVRLFKCEQCERVFTNKQILGIHQTSHVKERPFECFQCHKMFKTLVYVRAHLRTHAPGGIKRNSICELCGKAYSSSLALSDHIRTAHSDERPHKCEICGARFKIEQHLKVHLLTHSEAPRFKCNQCDRAFKSNHSLKNHLQTHSGVIAKKFPCDFCEMRFRTNDELKDHRSKHTGEKRFNCEQCSMGFGARSSFYTHMRKVHGISLLALKKEKLRT